MAAGGSGPGRWQRQQWRRAPHLDALRSQAVAGTRWRPAEASSSLLRALAERWAMLAACCRAGYADAVQKCKQGGTRLFSLWQASGEVSHAEGEAFTVSSDSSQASADQGSLAALPLHPSAKMALAGSLRAVARRQASLGYTMGMRAFATGGKAARRSRLGGHGTPLFPCALSAAVAHRVSSYHVVPSWGSAAIALGPAAAVAAAPPPAAASVPDGRAW